MDLYQGSKRKSRLTNQNTGADKLTSQNHDDDESVSDLLINSKDPKDNVKRPFTALIDREIARERSRSRERSFSQGSKSESAGSRSRSPSAGRPKFAYPERVINLGPLHDPIASSTHKSMEIKAQMSNNGDLDSPRSSLVAPSKGKGQGYKITGNGASKQNSKVMFSEKDQYNDVSQKHSPNVKSTSQLFNDPDYAQYYKKLSPDGRKRELLKQRQALLDEQQRLRLILDKQEQQLKERQYEYNKRQELQKERMQFYQEGGKFPALKLDFDGETDSVVETGRGLGTRNVDERGEIVIRGPELGAEVVADQEQSPRRNIEIGEY